MEDLNWTCLLIEHEDGHPTNLLSIATTMTLRGEIERLEGRVNELTMVNDAHHVFVVPTFILSLTFYRWLMSGGIGSRSRATRIRDLRGRIVERDAEIKRLKQTNRTLKKSCNILTAQLTQQNGIVDELKKKIRTDLAQARNKT